MEFKVPTHQMLMKTSPLIFGQTVKEVVVKEVVVVKEEVVGSSCSLSLAMDIQAVHGARCATSRRTPF